MKAQQKMEKFKPSVVLTEEGEQGNIFFLLAKCSGKLCGIGSYEDAQEMSNKVFESKSFENAKAVLAEYCKITWI